MVYDRQLEDEDVIIEREGTGVGTILGIILAIVVVLAIIWFFFLGGMNPGPTTPGTDTTPQTEVQPAPGGGELP